MFIASASTTVKLHDFPDGKVVYNYQPGSKVEGPIRSISWSRDGTLLGLVPFSGPAEVISIKEELRLMRTVHDVEEPSCIAFQNSTRKLMALGTKARQVLIYDVKAKAIKKRFPKTSSSVSHVDFTAKDTHCIAGCTNGDIFLYSNLTNNLSCTLRVPKSKSVTCLRANQLKRNLIIGGSNEGVVVVWDSNVNKAKFTMEAHKAPVTSVAFSPVNSDLVLSAGIDRQFCFYDIVDNKCIASVSVENSITSVDFSPEGTYFVMGSQNGSVSVYDSRNIQEPIESFVAHTSAVKHLFFQKCSEFNKSSCSSISSESIVPTHSSEDTSNKSSDLFGMFIQVPSNAMIDSIKTSGNSMEAGDSFIAALGLDKNNTDASFPQNEAEGTRKWFENKDTPSSVHPTKNLHDKMGLGDSKQAASTPKFLSTNFNTTMSPILAVNQGNLNATTADIQAAAKEAVKEELKGTLEEIRADIKFQSTHTIYQMRRMLLDLQMAMVREFIKVENYCNSIRDDITIESPRHAENNYLVEENEELKKKIEVLEQKLASLTASDDFNTGQSG